MVLKSDFEAVFFDLDDTLLNFKEAEKYSLYDMIKEHIHEDDFETHLVEYRKISHKLWDEYEHGQGSKESIRKDRFRLFFNYLGVSSCSEQGSEDFFMGLANNNHYMPGAQKVCEIISDVKPTYIITNGFEKAQIARVKNSMLESYFKGMVVSESCGFQKPDRRIFKYAMDLAKVSNPEKVLIIGDKLKTDIQGGNNVGWKTCWYNP